MYERSYKTVPTPKPWYASKTVWLNVLLGVVGGISTVVNDGQIDTETAEVLVLIGAIGNLVMRYLTGDPISIRRLKK